MTLANRISRLRKEKKLSQEFVADTLHVSRQAVSKWENGLSSPDTENLIALAKLLEVDVDFLATGELTEDVDSDPVEEPVPQLTSKPAKRHKWLLPCILILSILMNLLFVGLWQYEKHSTKEMAAFAIANAAQAADAFADYAHFGSDTDYWAAAGYFKAFMNAANWARDDFAYTDCNILYANLLFEKERCSYYLEDIRRIMRLLREDMDDPNVYLDIFRLNNEIKYGELPD